MSFGSPRDNEPVPPTIAMATGGAPSLMMTPSRSLVDVGHLGPSQTELVPGMHQRTQSNGGDSGVASPKNDIDVNVAESQHLIATMKQENEQLRRQLAENNHRMIQLTKVSRC